MDKNEVTVLVGEIKKALKPDFDAIYARFSDNDNSFASIDKKFAAVDKKFEIVDKKFEMVDKKFEMVDKKFVAVDKRFDEMDRKFDSLHETVLEFRRESFDHYDRIYKKLDFFKDEYYAMSAGLKRVEEGLKNRN